jgi:pimeloyl-ACP methyl ester carboxylesterase
MTDFVTGRDGVRIAYERVGEGDPILLIHGIISSRIVNWRDPGWYDALTGAGYSVIAMDCRGHGESDKPHDEAAYNHDIMARDALAVLAACGVNKTDVMGYSMGGFISIHLLMAYPQAVKRVILGGVGGTYLGENASGTMADPVTRALVADALLLDDPSSITNPVAKTFRAFADQGNKDKRALAACMRAMRYPYGAAQLADSTRPVLVVAGEKDTVAGPPGTLAAAFADGRAVTVPRRDHMTTVGDRTYKKAVLDFLAQ